MRILAGRYRLEERLGGGGMSVVWRAYDEVLGRPVAVKMVAGRHADEAVARERIRTEAKAAARLNHPHLTKLIDHSESGSTPYLVMELLEGQTLARRIRGGRLPLPAALAICAQVADALAAAHASGVVHRDVKPGNVMLTPAGATILDFGIAAFVDEPDEPATSESAAPEGTAVEDRIWGTAAYVAPERLTQRRVLPASDVYALGVLMYRALTGRRPWEATGRAEMLAAHVSVEPSPLPAEAGVPPEVAALCERCLAKEPRDRPTAREMATVLAAAAAGTVPARPASALAGARMAGARMAGAATTKAATTKAATTRTAGRRPRFQRRHAAPGAGRLRRNALRAGSATMVAAMVAVVSFCAVTDPTGQRVGPEAAPPPILPVDPAPPSRPKVPKPPVTAPMTPPHPSRERPARMRDTSGRAGGLSGSGAVPVRSGSRTGKSSGGGTSPSRKPRPAPTRSRAPTRSPTPTPSPTAPAPPPSLAPRPSPSYRDPIGDALSDVERSLDSVVCTLTAQCDGDTWTLVP